MRPQQILAAVVLLAGLLCAARLYGVPAGGDKPAPDTKRPDPKPDAGTFKLDWHPDLLSAGRELAEASRQVVRTGVQIEKTAKQIETTARVVEVATAKAVDWAPFVFWVAFGLMVIVIVILAKKKGAAAAVLLLTLTLASGCHDHRPPPRRECPQGHRECRCGCERGERCTCQWREEAKPEAAK